MYLCYGIMGMGFLLLCAMLGWSIRGENRNCLIFSPFLLFCGNEMVMGWPAVVFARWTGVSADNYAALVVVSSTLAFAFGYFAVREFNGWRATPYQYLAQPAREPNEQAHLLAIVGMGTILVLLGLYLYQGLPPAVTGLRCFLTSGYESGVAESVALKRLELTKGHHFGGEYRGQGIVRYIMRIGWPYLTAIALTLYIRRRQSSWRIISLGLVAACFVFIAGDGTRGPFLWAMVSLLVMSSYQTRLSLGTCAVLLTMLLGALLILSLTQKLSGAAERGTLWSEGVQQLAERIFVGNAIHSIHAIEFVRSGELELRWGTIHANDLAASLPFVSSGTPFVYELFLLENPGAKASRTTFANTTYLGIVYAEAGWLGCILGYLALGGMTAWISQKLFSRAKTATNAALAGTVATYVGLINLWGSLYCVVLLCMLFFVIKLYAFCFTLASTRSRPAARWSRAGRLPQPAIRRRTG